MRTYVLRAVAVAVLAAAFMAQEPSRAAAQSAPPVTTTPNGDTVDGEIAGIVGLGMIGVDIGLLLPPMFNLHDQGWAYGVFPLLLGGAGVGGGIALSGNVDKSVNIAFLAGGMSLFVPALVGTLAWRSNKLEADMEAQRSLIRFGRVNMHPPTLAAAPVYTPEERARYGVAQRTSTRLTLLSGTF